MHYPFTPYVMSFYERSFLGPAESKELSPGPLKWSPSIAKSTSVFKFYKNSTGPESAEMKQPENVDSTSNASIASNASDMSNASNASQRKRKDTRTNSEHTDSKKMSRSSRFMIICLSMTYLLFINYNKVLQ